MSFHAVVFPANLGLAGDWRGLADTLDTFRMPLFFFTSGLFAAKALRGTLSQLWRSRVARLLWLFVLWSVIWFVVFFAAPPLGTSRIGQRPVELVPMFISPNQNTWYVYALAVYFLAAWALRRLPTPVQIGLAAIVAVAFDVGLLDSPNGAVDRMGRGFVWFLVAVHAGPQVRALAPRVGWRYAVLALVMYGAAAVALAAAKDVPFVRLALAALAVLAGCTLAIVLSRVPAMDWLRELGQRTLGVYLVHFYVILGCCLLLAPVATEVAALEVVNLLLPLLLTVVAVLASLALRRATSRVVCCGIGPTCEAWQRRAAARGRAG